MVGLNSTVQGEKKKTGLIHNTGIAGLVLCTSMALVSAHAVAQNPNANPNSAGGPPSAIVGPQTYLVNCDNGESAQAAIDQATDGDIVEVNGTCNERITITLDRFTFDGGGTAIIDGAGLAGSDRLVGVSGANVIITGLTIKNANNTGLTVTQSSSVTIKRSIFENNRTGIIVSLNAFAMIGAQERTNHPAAGTGDGKIIRNNNTGISVRFTSGARIFHNLIIENGRGIRVRQGAAADLDGNEIINNTKEAVQMELVAAVRFSNQFQHGELNLIENNGTGISCKSGGAIDGKPQDYGVGNPGPVSNPATPHVNDTNIVDCFGGF